MSFRGGPIPYIETVRYEFTPVYSVCQRCGFRIRRKEIKTKL